MNKLLKTIAMSILVVSTSAVYAKTYTVFAYGEKGTPEYKLLLEKIKKFESTHNGVKIKLDTASGEAYHSKLKVYSVANKLPDVMTVFAGKRSDYITKKGLVADLKPFISQSVKNAFSKTALSPQGDNGEVYEIPLNLTLTGVVYANKKLMKKLGLEYPKTFKDWLSQVKTIQNAGLTPLSIGNKSPWVMQSIMLSAILGRTAGDEWLKKAVNGKASFTDKGFVKSLKILKKMYDSGLLDKATPSWDYNQGTNEFLASRAVYSMNGGWIVNNYIKNAPVGFLNNVELHNLPAFKKQVNNNSTSGTLGYGFGLKKSLSNKDKKILIDLVTLQAGLGISKESIAAGIVPLINNIDFPNNTKPIIKDLKKLTDNTKITYVIDAVMDPESVNLLQNSIQKIFLGTKTPKQVASELENYVAKNSPSRKGK